MAKQKKITYASLVYVGESGKTLGKAIDGGY